ncbi:MAG: oligosaccharide flippase family protein [Mariprofundaceae bacterium]|nr:oligosaccharide flippase family protein [Mariprofundaceae bacterium]
MKKILSAFMTIGSGTVISMIATVIANKTFALMLGPQGLGLFSIIRQASQSFTVLASFNGSSAVIQGMNSKPESEKIRYIISCIGFMFLFSIAIGLLMIFTAHWLAAWLFDDTSQVLLVYGISFAVWLTVGANIGRALLNGYLEMKCLAMVTALGGVGLALTAYPAAMLVQQGYQVALILPVITAALFSVFSAWFLLKKGGRLVSVFQQKKTMFPDDIKYFLNISAVVLLNGLAGVMSLLVVRSEIVQASGMGSAGIFAAAWAIGVLYTSLILGVFRTYLLPMLSRRDEKNKSVLIDQMLRASIFIIFPLLVVFIINKEWIITVLYAESFIPASDLLSWLLLGAYIQMTNHSFDVQILSNANMRLYLGVNVPFQLMFLGVSSYLVQSGYPLEWVAISFFCIVLIRMFVLFSMVRQRYHINIAASLVIRWLLGLATLIFCSVLTCSNSLPLEVSILLMGISMSLSLLMLNGAERKQGWLWIQKKRGVLT